MITILLSAHQKYFKISHTYGTQNSSVTVQGRIARPKSAIPDHCHTPGFFINGY